MAALADVTPAPRSSFRCEALIGPFRPAWRGLYPFCVALVSRSRLFSSDIFDRDRIAGPSTGTDTALEMS